MKIYKYHCLDNDFLITSEVPKDIKLLCDRTRGIGSDGLIVLNDLKMDFYNCDGTKALMCGNGIRCCAKYINDYIDETITTFNMNKDYTITHEEDSYTLRMEIPKVIKDKKVYVIDAGVKHVVVFSKPDLEASLYYKDLYNANVTFCNEGFCQTYELGVGFTKGCGTGLIAVMAVLYKYYNLKELNLDSYGGISNLRVIDNHIYLTSNVSYICTMEVTYD